MAIHNLVNILREKKNWKHTFYRLDKKGKKIFQNFTQYMHFKFIRTR